LLLSGFGLELLEFDLATELCEVCDQKMQLRQVAMVVGQPAW
jgi:hypothetical protein